MKPESIPGYKLIQSNDNDIFISLNNLNGTECEEIVQSAIRNKINIENYLENFVKISTNKYKKEKHQLILQDDDEDTEIASVKSVGTKKNKSKKNVTRKYKKALVIES